MMTSVTFIRSMARSSSPRFAAKAGAAAALTSAASLTRTRTRTRCSVTTSTATTPLRFFSSASPSPSSSPSLSSMLSGAVPQVPASEALKHISMMQSTDAAKKVWYSAIVDVREPDEFAQARIPGALNIPLGKVFTSMASDTMQRLKGKGPVLVHCKSGVRSAIATKLMRENGIDAQNLQGGFNAYLQEKAKDSGTLAEKE